MSDDRLRELGKQLPWHRPDHERRESVRSSLLVAVTEGSAPNANRRWLLVGGGFAAGALAAAAVAILVVRPARETAGAPHVAYAQIESSSAAELEHTRTPTATGTDELVRVRSGTVRLAVPAVRAGDHVHVQTADADVEGSGSYEVVVAGDALTSVAVTAGTASVRVRGQTKAVFLAAGQTWHAPVVTAELEIAKQPPAPPAPAVASPPSPTPAPAPHDGVTPPVPHAMTPAAPHEHPAPAASRDRAPAAGHRAGGQRSPAPAMIDASTVSTAEVARPPRPAVTEPPPSDRPVQDKAAPTAELDAARDKPHAGDRPAEGKASPTEQHFRVGWALLRAGKAAAAAIELGAAADTGDGPLASDARYFQAVALAKAGRAADAERALVAFLDHAPTSVRRGRAAVMLARLLVERGDRTTAHAWFDAASRDPDPSIAAAARVGLESLARRAP